jgi:hypothetical protein
MKQLVGSLLVMLVVALAGCHITTEPRKCTSITNYGLHADTTVKTCEK